MERTIATKCEAMGSKRGTTLLENKCVEEFTKIDGNTTSYSMKGIQADSRIRVEQDVDLVLKNMKLKNLGQPHEEMLITTDSR